MVEYIEREAARMEAGYIHGFGDDKYVSLKDIESIPAADVAPVVHGQWIKTVQENGCAEWTDFTCSVCGAVFDGNDYLFDEWRGCPVCLARMDGE